MLLSIFKNGVTSEAVMELGIYLVVILFSLSFHEMAHGYVAYRCGDATARNMGRITLNPMAHLNLIGTLMMLVFGFGYATPVPVNSRNFNHFKRDLVFVSLAGPVSNLILSFIFAVIMGFALPFLPYNAVTNYIVTFLYYMIVANASLAVFNLLPIPPLDGSRIVSVLLPGKIAYYYLRYEREIMLILFALLYLNVLDGVLIFLRTLLLKGILFVADLITTPIVKLILGSTL